MFELSTYTRSNPTEPLRSRTFRGIPTAMLCFSGAVHNHFVMEPMGPEETHVHRIRLVRVSDGHVLADAHLE